MHGSVPVLEYCPAGQLASVGANVGAAGNGVGFSVGEAEGFKVGEAVIAMQTLAPALEYDGEIQEVHVEAPNSEYVFAGQGAYVVCPEFKMKDPAGEARHEVEPTIAV